MILKVEDRLQVAACVRSLSDASERTDSQSGNIFVIIMLGVVLFGALMFIASRGMNESPQSISGKRARIVAAEVLDTAQTFERAVARLLSRGVSENDLSFENATVAGYAHAGCADATCRVFDGQGGGIGWSSSPADANDGSAWLFTGHTCVSGLGQGGAGCESDGLANEELVAVLPNMKKEVCEEINARLGISGIPVNAGSGYATTLFVGTFGDGAMPDGMDGRSAGCFEGGAGQPGYHFYSALIVR
jgi:hypothetical protein